LGEIFYVVDNQKQGPTHIFFAIRPIQLKSMKQRAVLLPAFEHAVESEFVDTFFAGAQTPSVCMTP
jgi:hypothetical protein